MMKVGYVKKVIGKKKWRPRTIQGVDALPNSNGDAVPKALQQLFVCCRHVFKNPTTADNSAVPLPHHVRLLSAILDKMKAEDVGLSRNMQFFNPNNINATKLGTPPRVTYTTIRKCSTFSLCLFFIPANGVIPLHNHPEMTVFSKLLLGKMHITSYDWVDHNDDDGDKKSSSPSAQSSPRAAAAVRLAKLKADSVVAAPCSKTSVLYPTTGGNIHSFRAITPCAVLDVIGPPYSKEDGRDSSYYTAHPFSSYSSSSSSPNHDHGAVDAEKAESYAWLEEIEMPEDSHMDVIEYLGPQIMDSNC